MLGSNLRGVVRLGWARIGTQTFTKRITKFLGFGLYLYIDILSHIYIDLVKFVKLEDK